MTVPKTRDALYVLEFITKFLLATDKHVKFSPVSSGSTFRAVAFYAGRAEGRLEQVLIVHRVHGERPQVAVVAGESDGARAGPGSAPGQHAVATLGPI